MGMGAKANRYSKTREVLDSVGVTHQCTETYIHQAKRFKDLFGFADYLALFDAATAIQVTGADAAQARKLEAEPRLREWLERCRQPFLVFFWRKLKVGPRQQVWALDVEVYLDGRDPVEWAKKNFGEGRLSVYEQGPYPAFGPGVRCARCHWLG